MRQLFLVWVIQMNIDIQETPNPNALKFLLDNEFATDSKQFNTIEDAKDDKLAERLFSLEGVENIFYLSNFITVTKADKVSWNTLEKEVKTVISENFKDLNLSDTPKKAIVTDERIQKIEEILNETVRPGLAMDGGGVEVVELTEDMVLSVRYKGACGSCPSSTYATLQAIMFILKDNFDERIEVIAV